MRKIISFRGYDKASNHIIYRNIPKNVSIDESYEKKTRPQIRPKNPMKIVPKPNAIHSLQYLPSFCLRPLWSIPTWDGWTIWQAELLAKPKKIEYPLLHQEDRIPIYSNHPAKRQSFWAVEFSCPTFWDVNKLKTTTSFLFKKDVPCTKNGTKRTPFC